MSEKQIKRVIDVNYENFQSLPRWRKIISEVVKAHVIARDPEAGPVSQMPDNRVRIELDPPQNIDTEELAAEIIDKLRTLEMSFILEEKRKEIEEEFYRRRLEWEDAENARRKSWEEKAEQLHEERLAKLVKDIEDRRDWEIQEAKKRREFELELTDDQLSRAKWERDEGDQIRTAQKKLSWILILSLAALAISIYGFTI